jgi:hypothetical protein
MRFVVKEQIEDNNGVIRTPERKKISKRGNIDFHMRNEYFLMDNQFLITNVELL